MPSKAELEGEVKRLHDEIVSIKADCGILLKENGDLIDLCKKHVPGFSEKDLFTSQWRGEGDETNDDNDG